MYLDLSALTSSPISLVAATKASAFCFRVCILHPSILTSAAITRRISMKFDIEDLGIYMSNSRFC